ncbi:hypothetical protein [Acinetobacter baumannii]
MLPQLSRLLDIASSVMIALFALSCKNFATASLPAFVRLLTIGSELQLHR